MPGLTSILLQKITHIDSPILMHQTITDWLSGTFVELSNLGHIKVLSDEQKDWLLEVYTHYQLSPAEAALYFIHEQVPS